MSFRKPLEEIVKRASGAVGAVFVDDDGESIGQFTNGSPYEISLAGAHHGIILQLMEKIVENVEDVETSQSLSAISITSDLNIFTMVPVEDGTFLVLVQDRTGIQPQGLRVLQEAVPAIKALI
ncbi:hypothetical protein EP232_05375 [bacterium]|nr:MAG: hypothetical protein EP232_05375 [bacterium]